MGVVSGVYNTSSESLGLNNLGIRREIIFQSPETNDIELLLTKFQVPIFSIDDRHYFLIRDIALFWGYPSSYQLIKKFLKAGVEKKDILCTNVELNNELYSKTIIKQQDMKTKLFYMDLSKLYSFVKNKEIFFELSKPESENVGIPEAGVSSDEKVTVGQVFPQYGLIGSTLELNPSQFNCLNSVSKLNFYKNLPNAYRYLPNSKLSFAEREIIYRELESSSTAISEETEEHDKIHLRRSRKPLGRSRKNNTSIDVNALDLQDSLIPGQGYIQEFNVNHICKVPNYYAQVGSSSSSGQKKGNSVSSLLFNDNAKISKHVQQLVSSSDSDNYSHVKYFYIRSYRGPGTGNFKDANIINRINKLPTTTGIIKKPSKTSKDVALAVKKRHNHSLKGLLHDQFNKSFAEKIIKQHSDENDDGANLEMLHNNLQFNILANTYRQMSLETWQQYYKFKLVDREQLSMKRRNPQTELLNRFTLPTAHDQIIRALPVELREEEGSSNVKEPVYYSSSYPDQNNPEFLTKIEIMKFPNSNEIGWDNLKKYRE
ncbi:uncharacterized protein PRCAT00002095001 [Priceomyces carsonii]|uniref:uncharacterized protein n=1 Tax=Priceomyces carsonii TaxID=28549 RepID=UPI002ED8AFF1|nr:unnamed protein product [Priceomyces carsonii]